MAVIEVNEMDLGKSAQRAKRVCGVIRYLFIVATVLYVLSWAVSLVSLLASMMGAGFETMGASCAYTFLYGALVVVFLLTMVRIFSDVVQGRAPFSENQANRLRLIAVLALLLVILELVFTTSMSYNIIPEVGYSLGINDAYPADSINLNVGMLAFSAIMYSLSALFRYAALLQQLSDDTV